MLAAMDRRSRRREEQRRAREQREADRREHERLLAASPDRHPDLPEGGFLAEANGRLVALRPASDGVELFTRPGTEAAVVPGSGVQLGRPGRLKLASAGEQTRRVRLVGSNDHRDARLGDDVSLHLGGSAGGSDPISAVLGIIELLFVLVFGPPMLLRRSRRRSRGRAEWPRLAAAVAASSSPTA